MKKFIIIAACLLASCAPQEVKTPDTVKAVQQVNSSTEVANQQAELTINEVLIDERLVEQLFGSVFTAATEEQLEEILIQQLSTFDQRIGVIYTGEVIPTSAVDSIMNKLVNEQDVINGTLYTSDYFVSELEDSYFIDINSKFMTNKIEMASIIPARDALLDSLQLNGKTEREKLELIHRAVIEGMDYAYNEDKMLNHSPAAFFLYERGVCQAYAMAMYMLLTEAGIETRFVGGELKTAIEKDTRHAWNLVKIDGVWRHVDSTLNDRGNAFDNQVSKAYYLLTDELMSGTHIWEQKYYPEAK
ncbi:transglutaminase-like domain-containing protein [Solibacillus sp. CAU 1738]|uniref:transglutaminase domain-containing protein n=1 Tax=Solibacillus sp. CAU 1738 TaxID=3140363 RepID=UPI00326195AE